MSTLSRVLLVIPFLLLCVVGCVSNPKHGVVINDVMVASFDQSPESLFDRSHEPIADQLTFDYLHQHGITAVGAGNAGTVCIEVAPNQANEAHKLLQEEWSGLSQKEQHSFQIIWDWEKGNVNAPDFLSDIPSLKQVKPNMSEAKFLTILHQAKLNYKVITASGQTTYWVRLNDLLLVQCGFRDSQCCHIMRIDGYDEK